MIFLAAAALVVGLLLVAAGAAMVYLPAGVIVAGIFLAGAGLLGVPVTVRSPAARPPGVPR